jgi:putative transposase
LNADWIGASRSVYDEILGRAARQYVQPSMLALSAGAAAQMDAAMSYAQRAERLAEAGIEPSVGSRGDSYDNALAESVIGLFKTEVIRPRGPWRSLEDVEFATLTWVWWFNNHRLLGSIGHLPPAEFEELYHRGQDAPEEPLALNSPGLR